MLHSSPAPHVPELRERGFECYNLALVLRGHVHMTSAKFSKFLTPPLSAF